MNRLRLSGAYVAIMLAGLLLFAAAAVFAIDRTQRSTLDARLATAGRAAATFVDVSHGQIRIDADDRQQFLTVLGADTDGAVFDMRRRVLLSSAARVPPDIAPPAGTSPVIRNAGHGDAIVRVFSWPMLAGGKRLGTVVVWRSSDWIDETDRGLAIVLAGAALLIAGLALLAGNFVTRRALEDAFARQRRFTADASHELRAPLAVIRAEADLAIRKEREPAQYRAALETIASEADYMESLIGDLLTAARAESGHVQRERVDASAILERVAERLQPAAAAKGASIDVQAAPGAFVVADGHALERALLAIGHNAVRYAAASGKVELHARRSDHTVEIAVQDNGPGFSREALDHALERFWREPGAAAGTGSGLGLAIARSVVEANEGTIMLSNAANGAQVRLRFPAA
ncbi:MAG TPA: HAMP domain-containing sensor histidine kinase [Candidatus Baltobacteraceae bacterium]|nr:HAMP domain-containing sensor histidine kinase [Candidatus Baltobacteraceae bacterium]